MGPHFLPRVKQAPALSCFMFSPKYPPQFSYSSFPGPAGQRCFKKEDCDCEEDKKKTPQMISTLLKALKQNQIRVNAGGCNVSILFETEV